MDDHESIGRIMQKLDDLREDVQRVDRHVAAQSAVLPAMDARAARLEDRVATLERRVWEIGIADASLGGAAGVAGSHLLG